MIFQHTWQQVLDGTKTQTRRLALPQPDGTGSFKCEWLLPDSAGDFIGRYDPMRPEAGWQDKYRVGKTYAVCPARCEAAVGRIKITGIRRQSLQLISADEAYKEGIRVPDYFTVGNRSTEGALRYALAHTNKFAQLWDSFHTKKGERWRDDPEVWVLEFELVD